MPPDKGSFYNN